MLYHKERLQGHAMDSKDINSVIALLQAGEPVRRRFPGIGTLHVDRPLPFLCLYRTPPGEEDRGTRRLISAEAAYFLLTEHYSHREVKQLLRRIIEVMVEEFGRFLLLEIRTARKNDHEDMDKETISLQPEFLIHAIKNNALRETVESSKEYLEKVKIRKKAAVVHVKYERARAAWFLRPLLTVQELNSLKCMYLNLETFPIYRSPDNRTLYPLVLRTLRRSISRALKRTFHSFAKTHTTHIPPSYLALGQRVLAQSVWKTDSQLADIDDRFDFLLQVTPVNIEKAWNRFKRRRFEETPRFVYRPLGLDPSMMKRKLFQVPIERVEDPTLENLFRRKQVELDRQLTMLMDRGTRNFLCGSLQLYGQIEPGLLDAAHEILDTFPPSTRDSYRGGSLAAPRIAEKARAEFQWYKKKYPGLTATVQVRDDIYSGLLVSRGNLLIGKKTRIPATRADALMQHEIGTHVVTYHNGRAQPFRQLYVGLDGYDELQEGLGVLAEYLVGGLSRARLRLLAARVIAAERLTRGASFIDVFRLLNSEYGFTQKTAFTITMRIYRGGGFTKDAVYLRGLLKVLEYLSNGGTIHPLYVGKIAVHHISFIKELQLRKVLQPVPLTPRFLYEEDARKRLNKLRKGYSLAALTTQKKKEANV